MKELSDRLYHRKWQQKNYDKVRLYKKRWFLKYKKRQALIEQKRKELFLSNKNHPCGWLCR